MFRIRFHGRGGQGMKTASLILGTAFFKAGYEVQDAPRYGAERRGAPIFAYVRADKCAINERGIISHPDLVVVADDTLVGMPAAGVTLGVDAHTVLLINSHESGSTWRQRLNTDASILTLAAREDAEDRATLPFIGSRCAAAAAALTGVISRDVLIEALCEELGHLNEAIIMIWPGMRTWSSKVDDHQPATTSNRTGLSCPLKMLRFPISQFTQALPA